MLNVRYSENTLLTTPAPIVALRVVKDENEVKRVVPHLQPVAIVRGGEGGVYASRASAAVYTMPDNQLGRVFGNPVYKPAGA